MTGWKDQPRDTVASTFAAERDTPSAPELAGPAPRYELLYQDLYARIRSGEYAVDTKLPSERELTLRYRVSRTTLRHALARAEREGLVTRIPGRGNFVARRRVAQDLSHMQTFRSVISAMEMKPSYTVLASQWVTVPMEVIDRLGVAADSKVLRVDAVGMASDRPMASYRSYLAPSVASQVSQALGSDSRSTYELAAFALGLDRLQVEQTFDAILVDDQAAARLEVSPGSSAFRVTSIFTTPAGDPVEWRLAIYPGGRYSFLVRRPVVII